MNILIIEDDAILANQIASVFDAKVISNRIQILHSPIEFITELPFLSAYDIVITDLQLWKNSTELWWYKIIQLVRERNMKIPIIVLSGRTEIEVLRTCIWSWCQWLSHQAHSTQRAWTQSAQLVQAISVLLNWTQWKNL